MGARIQLCGSFEVELEGERIEHRLPGHQGPLLLALLALNRTRPVGRDELLGTLWPGELPAKPNESLNALLSKVRRAVGHERLVGRRHLKLTLPDDAYVDVEAAYAAAERAEAAVARQDWRTVSETAEAAADIAARGFLVGHDNQWVEDRRIEIEELRLRALEMAAAAGIELGGEHLAAAERSARELVRSSPLREAGHRLLMEALAAHGEVAEALGAYEELRVLLRDELGTTPGEAVRSLHERLLAGDVRRPQAARAAGSTASRTAAPAPLPAPLARAARPGFVGRGGELDRLRAAWQATRDGQPDVVLLTGGPGIGKTRLAAEIATAAHVDGTVLYGACQEDALVPYQPFVEALRHYARHTPTGSDLGAGAAELARLIPERPAPLDAAAALPDDPETRRYLMFEAVAALLAEACNDAPVLLVLDDLHWADRSTLQLMRHLLRAQHDTALLMVGTYRDAEVTAGYALADLLADLRREGPLERVALDGLDRDGVSELVEAHAGEPAPSPLVEALHEDTGGNPFFVGEMVRHLVESGVAIAPDARWSQDSLAREIGIPEGVKDVLGLRFARLSDPCRAILANAAVLGREFGFEILAGMAAVDTEVVIGALEEALGARLVTEREDAGETAYEFVHALVRETLYEGISAPRRQRLHARAADALETAGAAETDDGLAALALHHRLAGPVGDPAKAIDYSLRASDRARGLFAWDEALAHMDGALGLMERTGADAGVRGRLLVGLAQVCTVLGDITRQIGYLERALALYTEHGDVVRAAQVHSRLGTAHSHIDSIVAQNVDVDRAFRHFDAARAVLEQGPARASRGHLDTGVAWAMTYAMRIGPGLDAAGRAMDVGEAHGDELLWAGAAQVFGWHTVATGNLAQGFEVLERSFAVADRHRHAFLAFMGTQTRGQLTWGLGAPTEAQAFLERPQSLPYMGETAYRHMLADAMGRCHASRGEFDEARELLADAQPAWVSHSLEPLLALWDGAWDQAAELAEEALMTSRRTGNRWDEWAAHHLAGRVAHLRGDLPAAITRLEQAAEIVSGGGATYFEMWVRPDLARALADAGRLDEARAQADRCLEVIEAGEDWRGRGALAELADAIVLGFEGHTDAASARFASAFELLERHQLVAEQADCLHEWGRALARAGDGPAARAKLDDAASLYAERGAGAAWLDRVAAATGVQPV